MTDESLLGLIAHRAKAMGVDVFPPVPDEIEIKAPESVQPAEPEGVKNNTLDEGESPRALTSAMGKALGIQVE